MEAPAPTIKHRILVIDDKPEIHEDFRKILCTERWFASRMEEEESILFGDTSGLDGQSQFEIESAHQGQEGLAKVYHAIQEGRPFEMAFVDVRMPPGWDGIEVTPRLWMADPELQIVICTAYSDYSWEEMFARLGASDRMFILKKPFDRAEVLQLAHTLTEKRQRLAKRRGRAEPAKRRDQSDTEVCEKFQSETTMLRRVRKDKPA